MKDMRSFLCLLGMLFWSSTLVFSQELIKVHTDEKGLVLFQRNPQKFLVNWSESKLVSFELSAKSGLTEEAWPVLFAASIASADGKTLFKAEKIKATLFPGNIFFPANIFFPGNIFEQLAPGQYLLTVAVEPIQKEHAVLLRKYSFKNPTFKFQR